jgi:hypothetical protein
MSDVEGRVLDSIAMGVPPKKSVGWCKFPWENPPSMDEISIDKSWLPP